MRAVFLLALLVIGAVVTATVAKAVSNQTRATSEGVSSLTYAPKPFYDNLSRMKVRFATTARARPGFEYVVTLLVSGPSTGSWFQCDETAVSGEPGTSLPPSAIHGAPGRTYVVWLLAGRKDGGHFCRGRASLSVVSASASRPSSNRRLRTLAFRILPAS